MADSSSSRHDLSSCQYDVFISFRGEDTRKGFVSHLHGALQRKSIEAYKDDVSLPRGEEISPALVKAIEDSKISVVVFSENYATSGWCLDELVHILRCRSENGQIFLPIFYGVDPSHVRNQKESYAKAFVAHEERFRDDVEKVKKWRSVLEETGKLSGWDSRTDGSEPEFVQKIVQDILQKLSSMSPTKGDELESKLVGVEDRLKKIEELLCFDSPDVRIVGIWGMGGIGKTALAEEMKKRFASRFESCFFEDVSEGVKRCGLEDLKKSLFATLLNEKNIDMNSSFNKVRLQRRKVLVVLDNVDNLRHLVSLIGKFPQNKSQFGKESKILITSRDTESFQADATYKVPELVFEEALKLFYQNAFRTDSSKVTDYEKLSKAVVGYAGGNPLALIVLGSYLHSESNKGPRSIKEWESALIELKNAPNEDIQEVLKISYNALDHQKQSIFLDIACFFKGADREFVEEILGDGSHIGISVLIEKSLVTIRNSNTLWVHDLIREMSCGIVRQESEEPGERSRLWTFKDISSVLKANKGSEKIKGIYQASEIKPKRSRNLYLEPTIFENMGKLRFLHIYGSQFRGKVILATEQGLMPLFNSSGCRNNLTFIEGLSFKFPSYSGCLKLICDQGLKSLPDSLRYLSWSHFPLKSLPSNFKPQNLVRLEMKYSELEKLWDGVKQLGNLKYVDLSWSENLTKLPNLSKAPKLETIDVSGCRSLCQLPKMPVTLKELNMMSTAIKELGASLRSLTKLELLNLAYCKRLNSIPNNCLPHCIQDIKADYCELLKMINICGCDSLKKLSAYCCESLEVIEASECTSLQKIKAAKCPSLKYLNMINIKSIEKIDVSKCTSLTEISVSGHTSLTKINTSGCMSLKRIDASGCTSLKKIYARKCTSVKRIDASGCTSLKKIYASKCTSVERIDASGCTSLKKIYAFECTSVKKIDASGCTSLDYIEADGCASLEIINAHGCTSLREFSINGCTSLKYFHIKDFESVRIIEAGRCTSLTEIDISGCISLTEIDLNECTSLEIIDARGCTSLGEFLANECSSLKKFIYVDENGSKSWVKDKLEYPSFSFAGCLELEQSARDNILFLFQSYLFGSTIALNDAEDKFKEASASACYVGDVIPKWFSHQSKGFSITITLPQGWYNTNFIGFATSVVFGFEDASTSHGFSYPNIVCSLDLKTRYGSTLETCTAVCPLTSFSFEKITQEWYSKDHVLMWHAYTHGFSDNEESTINNAVKASFIFFFDFQKDKEDDEDDTEDEEEDDTDTEDEEEDDTENEEEDDEEEDEDEEEVEDHEEEDKDDKEEDKVDEEDEEEVEHHKEDKEEDEVDEEEMEDHKEDKEDDNDDSFNEDIKAIVKRCGIRMMYLQEAEGFGFSSIETRNVSKNVDLSIKAISPSHEKDSMTSVWGASKKK